MSRRSGELGLLLLIAGCSDNREIPPPCEALVFDSCAGGFVELQEIGTGTGTGTGIPTGIDALGADGDILLGNDKMIAVIDALDHPDYLSPTGGAVLDLVTRDSQDSLNHLFQGTGLLPGDAPFYTSMQFLSGDNYRAVIVRGTLAGHPKSTIVTRYEVRPCEPGFRMRTEVVNGEPDAAIWTVTDAWYWGGRSVLPFTPYPGAGFVHPDFKLTTVGDVFRDVPYLAASGHSAPGTNSAYAEVACSADTLSGFHATTISAMGTKRRIVEPRDSIVFERFVGVAKGDAIEPAVAIAADVRRRLFGEAYVALAGKVVGSTTARVIVSDSTGTPWSETLPAADGTYTLTVPANRSLKVEAQAFGRTVASVNAEAGSAPDLVLPPIGRVELDVAVDGRADEALVFFHPADDATRAAVTGKFLGNFVDCAPLLGPPHGSSPACNRVLVGGRIAIEAPPGRYDVYASAGPFATLARATIEVRANETASVALALERLSINPSGTLTADFHVHGGASFDSSIPDVDRVRAFLASGIDVLAATDHDIVSDYGSAIDALHARDKIALMTGVETTGQILWNFVPDQYIPKVIGHWNFWPLPYRPTGTRRGAPIDDLVEPYVLFDRARALGLPASGVIQLNHPLTDAELGRDLGFITAIEQKLNEPPVPLLTRNLGYDTQEVMNGTDNDHFLTYRAFWFYLLNRGIVRAATANSDSHGLTDNVLGTPRNVVWTHVQRDRFEPAAFNADVKRGRIVGTNGPMIEVWTTAADGSTRAPSIEAFLPAADASLHLRVSAAPWVPIDEVRVVVNGAVVKTIAQPELVGMGSDPFSRDGLVRYEGSLALAPLLPASGDSWLVIEAGAPLLMTADLNCDGIPDTGDNNGDGVIDWKDVDRDDPIDSAPDECDPDQEVGPLPKPPVLSRDAAGYHFQAVTPGGYPIAFTNPFLFGAWGAKMIALLMLAMSSTVACDDSAMFDPVEVPFNDRPFSSVRRACQRDEYSFGINAPIIAQPKKFYGNIRLSGILSGSTTVLEDTELFAELEVVRYQQVIASLSASYFGLGHLALGATERALTGDGWELAATAHATLPTAIGLYSRTYPLALDAGATGTTRISDELELHAYAGGRGTIGVGAGPADPRAAVILDAGVAWRVASWFAFSVDLEGAAGERALLDHAALGAGMRFRAADGLRFDVALKAPVAGDERALASAYVGVAYWR